MPQEIRKKNVQSIDWACRDSPARGDMERYCVLIARRAQNVNYFSKALFD